MSETDRFKKQRRELRKTAENMLPENSGEIENSHEAQVQALIHDLEVHRIELEIQNEALQKAQAELDASRNRYFSLFELAPTGYFTLDKEGLILEVNIRGADLLGVERRDAINRDFYQFVVPDDRDKFYLHKKKVLESGSRQTCELAFIKKDGTSFFAQLHSIAAEEDNGTLSQLRTALTDLTDRKMTEGALQASEERYRMLFNSVNDAVFVHQPNADGTPSKFIEVNDVACRRYGYTRAELLNLTPLDLNDPEEGGDVRAHIKRLFAEKRILFETVQRAKGGRKIPVEIQTHLFDLNGQPTVISTARDITQRKRVYIELRRSEKRFRKMAEVIPVVFWLVSPDWAEVIYVSPAFEAVYGRTCESLYQNATLWLDAIHREDLDRVLTILQENHGKKMAVEYRIVRPDGSVRWIRDATSPIRDENGDLVLLAGFCQDITESKQAQDALRESEEKYHSIFENIQDVYYEVSLEGTVLEISPSIEEISEYERKDLVGKSLYDLGIYDHAEQRGAFLEELLKKGKVTDYEVTLRDKDGTERYCSTTAKITGQEDRATSKIIGSLRDIDARKRIESAFREREETMRAILAASPVGIGLVRNRVLDWANKAMYNMLGYDEGFLMGKNAEVLYPGNTEYEHVGRELYPELMEKGVGRVETRWVKKDGTLFDCYLQASPLDPSDHGKGFIVAVLDISARKKAEDQIHTLSQQLISAQENERQRIARELHDRVAQDLSTLKIGIDTLFDDHADWPAKNNERVSKLAGALQETIGAVRNLAYDLRPPGLDQFGLVQTISQYCEDFTTNTNITVDLHAAGMDRLTLDFDTKINLYRLIQEGLNNVRKHADAGVVTVRVIASSPNVILRIEDDGKGFDVKERMTAMDSEKRMGLRSMEERVGLMGGKMRILSRPSRGTKIFIEVPYTEIDSGSAEKHPDY